MTEARLKVLSFIHSLELGGCERDAMRLAKMWCAHGIDASVAIGRREGQMKTDAEGAPLIDLAVPGLSTRHFETSWMMARLPAVIRRVRPDVLVLMSNNHASIGMAMKLVLGRACPPLVLRVSNDLCRHDLSALGRKLHVAGMRIHAPLYDCVVAMAAPAIPEIEAVMGIGRDRIVTIDNATLTRADLARFASARDAQDRRTRHRGRRFLAVGRLAPQKNFGLLIDAFARMAQPDDELAIIGEGPCRSGLEGQIARLGLAGRVQLPGYRAELQDWFAAADAFVLSSDFEGLGNVVVEAMAAGVPVVATACCAVLPSLIADAGEIVPIRDAAALGAAMDRVAGRSIDVAAARARAGAFTAEAAAPSWLSLFAGLRRQSSLGPALQSC